MGKRYPRAADGTILLRAEVCAACGKYQDIFTASIHRDGFGVGPEVPLCDGCGLGEMPTCEELWDSIAARCAAELR